MSEYIKNLPALPDGWQYEYSGYGPHIVHVVWPGHGAMTIDLNERTFSLGWSIPHRAAFPERKYVGRNWKADLVGDVVKNLQGIFEEKQ